MAHSVYTNKGNKQHAPGSKGATAEAHFKAKSQAIHNKKDKVEGKMKKGWAETLGQILNKQLRGTITGKKFGSKSY